MTGTVLLLLALSASGGLLAWWVRPVPSAATRAAMSWLPVAVAVGGLLAAGITAGLAAFAGLQVLAFVVVLLVAAIGGGPVAALVLRLQPSVPPQPNSSVPPLRGGAAIGVLERLAIAATLLAGLPEGVAVVLAVKGLGRYPELRQPGTSERFILGTFTSVLWAAGCAGIGLLVR